MWRFNVRIPERTNGVGALVVRENETHIARCGVGTGGITDYQRGQDTSRRKVRFMVNYGTQRPLNAPMRLSPRLVKVLSLPGLT